MSEKPVLNDCCRAALEAERAERKERHEREHNRKDLIISSILGIVIPFMLITTEDLYSPYSAAFFWFLSALVWLNLFLKLKKHMKQRADKSPPA